MTDFMFGTLISVYGNKHIPPRYFYTINHLVPDIVDLAHVPHQPGVYFFKDNKGNILYIGKAKNLFKRVSQYYSPGSVWKQDMMTKAHKLDFVIVNNESEALFLEDNLIKQHQPPYNSLWKGDNSYVFIKITKEQFPQIFLTRKRNKDGATYIGPKRSTQSLKKILQYTRMLFQYRGCKSAQFKQGKLCSDYFFGLCKGRCVFAKLHKDKAVSSGTKGRILDDDAGGKKGSFHSDEDPNKPSTKHENSYITEAKKLGLSIDHDYDHYVQQNQDMMKYIISLFDGNPQAMIDMVYEQIQSCIKTKKFERAGRLKEVYQGLEQFNEKQTVVLETSITGRIYKLLQINHHYVYVLIHLYQGKLIDVIQHKLSSADTSLNEILTLFEASYGMMHLTVRQGNHYTRIQNILLSSGQAKDRQMLLSFIEQQLSSGVIGVGQSIKKFTSFAKDIDHLLDKFLDSYILSNSWQTESIMSDLLQQLQTRYHLKHLPYRIECIDVSHLSGGRMSGGLSCIIAGIPYKKYYRRYKIRQEKKSDDYQSLKEIIRRRFGLEKKDTKEVCTTITNTDTSGHCEQGETNDVAIHSKAKIDEKILPDLFILDGGKAQLNIVKKLLAATVSKSPDSFGIDCRLLAYFEHVQFAALEKGDARSRSSKTSGASETFHLLLDDGNIISKDLSYDKTDRLLTSLRDEAHRFANAYRKKQMEEEWKRS